eukprot:5932889-Pleurochrysis_carterae.AAC.2
MKTATEQESKTARTGKGKCFEFEYSSSCTHTMRVSMLASRRRVHRRARGFVLRLRAQVDDGAAARRRERVRLRRRQLKCVAAVQHACVLVIYARSRGRENQHTLDTIGAGKVINAGGALARLGSTFSHGRIRTGHDCPILITFRRHARPVSAVHGRCFLSVYASL